MTKIFQTTRDLNKALKPLGVKAHNGRGYFYFQFMDARIQWHIPSVYTMRVSDMPSDQWICHVSEHVERMHDNVN